MAEEVELCVEIPPNMEDVWEEALDVDRLCRACANTNESMIPIFEGDGIEHELQAKIAKHLPVKITKEDGLPHQMCFQCASTLVAWHDMFTNCIEAEKKLTNLVNKAKDAKDDEQELQEMEEMEEQVIEEEVIETSIAEDMAIEKFTTDVQERTVREMEMDDDNREDDVEAAREDDVEGIDENSGKKEDRAGTTIRDQVMVVSKNSKQTQNVSLVLHMNENENILELTSDLFTRRSTEKTQAEFVRYVREKYALDENQVITVKVNPSNRINCGRIIRTGSSRKFSTGVGSYFCEICRCRFRFLHRFEQHMESHKASIDGNEENASVDLDLVLQLGNNKDEMHSTKKRKSKPYCETCKKYFGSRSGLSYHLKYVHLGIKEEKCDICGRCFAMKNALREHRRIHTGECPFVCQVCGRAVRTSSLLYSHSKIHSDERPFVCEVCNVGFKFYQHLRKHEMTHTGEKNIICEICGKSFRATNDLRRHKIIHNGLKPFSCPMCAMKFNQKRYLKNHLRYKHHLSESELLTVLMGIKKEEVDVEKREDC